MSRLSLAEIGGFIRQHWRRLGLYGLGIVAGALIIVQLAMPWDNLPLYATVDGVSISGMKSGDAVKLLDSKYAQLPINLVFGNSPKAYRQPHAADIGLKISSLPQVTAAAYPLWLRLVPTSLWWAHRFTPVVAADYQRDSAKVATYVTKELGQSCDVSPENASVVYKDKKLQLVPAIDGGTCKLSDVQQTLAKATPNLFDHTVHIKVDQRPATIHDDTAKLFITSLSQKTTKVLIKAGDTIVPIPQDTFLTWLGFSAPNTGIVATLTADRTNDFFTKELAPKVAAKPGTSKVTTLDFTEVSRDDGPSGRAIDSQATIDLINQWLAGNQPDLAVQTMEVAPTPIYTRTYTSTDTGMTALITQYAQAHSGTFGVSFAELDGQHRHAGYQDTKVFRTASTYKLFVAYSTLKRIENGTFHWSDQIQGGRDLTKCFDDMIVKSDNACAEALLNKIGFSPVTKEIQALGLRNSSFLGDYIQTTAADLTLLTGALQNGQLLSPSSTSTLLNAMKRNIYRQGIPAGASGQVADKVGFLDKFLHDAAIVYSPSGTYALTIMTDGSSWGTIADLTRQIEKLRSQG